MKEMDSINDINTSDDPLNSKISTENIDENIDPNKVQILLQEFKQNLQMFPRFCPFQM